MVSLRLHGNFQKTKFCQFLLFPAVKISAKIQVKFLNFALFIPNYVFCTPLEKSLQELKILLQKSLLKYRFDPYFGMES